MWLANAIRDENNQRCEGLDEALVGALPTLNETVSDANEPGLANDVQEEDQMRLNDITIALGETNVSERTVAIGAGNVETSEILAGEFCLNCRTCLDDPPGQKCQRCGRCDYCIGCTLRCYKTGCLKEICFKCVDFHEESCSCRSDDDEYDDDSSDGLPDARLPEPESQPAVDTRRTDIMQETSAADDEKLRLAAMEALLTGAADGSLQRCLRLPLEDLPMYATSLSRASVPLSGPGDQTVTDACQADIVQEDSAVDDEEQFRLTAKEALLAGVQDGSLQKCLGVPLEDLPVFPLSRLPQCEGTSMNQIETSSAVRRTVSPLTASDPNCAPKVARLTSKARGECKLCPLSSVGKRCYNPECEGEFCGECIENASLQCWECLGFEGPYGMSAEEFRRWVQCIVTAKTHGGSPVERRLVYQNAFSAIPTFCQECRSPSTIVKDVVAPWVSRAGSSNAEADAVTRKADVLQEDVPGVSPMDVGTATSDEEEKPMTKEDEASRIQRKRRMVGSP